MFAIIVLAVVAVGAIVYTGGGHAVDGFGHDMKKTGDRIENNY